MSGILLAASVKRTLIIKFTDFAINSNAPEGQASDAAILFNADGTVDERRDLAGGGQSTTTSEASPWSNRVGEDGSGYHMRLASHDSGTNRYTGGAIPSTWFDLTSAGVYNFQDSDTSGPYDGTSTYTFELSEDGGSTVLDDCTGSIRLQNVGP